MKVNKNETIVRVESKDFNCGDELIDTSVSSFRAFGDEDHRIIGEPSVEIPLREQWLSKNPEAFNLVRKGIEESAQGKVETKGSFQKYFQD